MTRTLTLEIPEGLYRILETVAAREGKTAGTVGADCLASALQRLANDPLMQLAGVLESGTPDLAQRHDDYLGQQLADELSRRTGE